MLRRYAFVFLKSGKIQRKTPLVSRTSFLSWLKQSINHCSSGCLKDKNQVELVGLINIFCIFPNCCVHLMNNLEFTSITSSPWFWSHQWEKPRCSAFSWMEGARFIFACNTRKGKWTLGNNRQILTTEIWSTISAAWDPESSVCHLCSRLYWGCEKIDWREVKVYFPAPFWLNILSWSSTRKHLSPDYTVMLVSDRMGDVSPALPSTAVGLASLPQSNGTKVEDLASVEVKTHL